MAFVVDGLNLGGLIFEACYCVCEDSRANRCLAAMLRRFEKRARLAHRVGELRYKVSRHLKRPMIRIDRTVTVRDQP